MKPFACTRCGNNVFFENSSCAQCGAVLGFVPDQTRIVAFEPSPAGDAATPWSPIGDDGPPLLPCANRTDHAVCNWMVDADLGGTLCRSCRLNLTIPNLAVPGHLQRWAAVEAAKRRLVYGARRLGLVLEPKRDAADKQGLGFHLLVPEAGAAVVTGHDDGTITLDLLEADDVHREAVRARFGEPWRTLLGHLRHEFSHYVFHRWIAGDAEALATFRNAFGDESVDYDQALQAYHAQGPQPGWEGACISAYASAHPHEDWAETCAHWLLIVDAVETASAWGMSLQGPAASAVPQAEEPHGVPADQLVLQQWLPVAQFLNAMHRSLGLRDSYPFLLPPAVLEKMRVVAELLQRAAQTVKAEAEANDEAEVVSA